jgi:hypothetical protein
VKPLVLAAGDGAVVLRGTSVSLDTDVGNAFVTDCARNTEGLLADDDVMATWTIAPKDWAALAHNGPLLLAVRAERERRLTTGEAAREAAQRQFAKAPNILGGILADAEISPRHRIEAARELRAAAATGAKEGRAQGERFTLTINLGAGESYVYDLGFPITKQIDGEGN